MILRYLKGHPQKILLIYFFAVFLLHVIPTGSAALNRVDVFTVRLDHLLHSVIFLPWMVLVWFQLNFSETVKEAGLKKIAGWLLTGIFLAVFFEGLQYWIPYRSFNWVDVTFNVLGVLAGSLIFLASRERIESILAVT